jgi:hypothetical protein
MITPVLWNFHDPQDLGLLLCVLMFFYFLLLYLYLFHVLLNLLCDKSLVHVCLILSLPLLMAFCCSDHRADQAPSCAHPEP